MNKVLLDLIDKDIARLQHVRRLVMGSDETANTRVKTTTLPEEHPGRAPEKKRPMSEAHRNAIIEGHKRKRLARESRTA